MKKIQYLNTDFDLVSNLDFGYLNKLLSSKLNCLNYAKGADKKWRGCYETKRSYGIPLKNIEAFIRVLKHLDKEAKRQLSNCKVREFNMGFDCGEKPWAYQQSLSDKVLSDIASVRISLALTLYPAV